MTSLENSDDSGPAEPELVTETVTYWRCLHPEHRHKFEEIARLCIQEVRHLIVSRALEQAEIERRRSERTNRRSEQSLRIEQLIESESRLEGILWLRDKGLTYRAIAQRLGVSPSRVSQITDAAERRRRRALRPLQPVRGQLVALAAEGERDDGQTGTGRS